LPSLPSLRLFLAMTGAILAAGAATLGFLLTHAVEGQALRDRRQSLSRYVDGVLRPLIVRDGKVHIREASGQRAPLMLEQEPDILSVKVWRGDGMLLWASIAPERIGRRFPLGRHLAEALWQGRASGEIETLEARGEHDLEARRLGRIRVIEAYAPIVDDHGRVLGAYEIYADARPLEPFLAGRRQVIWVTVAFVVLALSLALALLIRAASRTLRRQAVKLRQRSQELLESYRQLEESALQAVESLNATIEAKDPYTAGHSRRVEELAARIARQLQLPEDQIDTVRLGALFHDIGTIAVPDRVLAKPGRLEPEEVDHLRRHVLEGARIVAKLARLQQSVPIVRYHHERLGRHSLPGRPARERDPDWGSGGGPGRRLRRHDYRAALRTRADRRGGLRRDPTRARDAVRPSRGRCLLRPRLRRRGGLDAPVRPPRGRAPASAGYAASLAGEGQRS